MRLEFKKSKKIIAQLCHGTRVFRKYSEISYPSLARPYSKHSTNEARYRISSYKYRISDAAQMAAENIPRAEINSSGYGCGPIEHQYLQIRVMYD